MKNKTWLVLILVAAAINIYCFWPGNLYFLNDDLLHIPLTDQGHLFQTNSVRPIHELLVRLDLFLWGKHAYGYHVTALLLHLIVCFQLYDLFLVMQQRWLKISRQQAMQAALLTVFLFLIYPQSSEAIAWIIGRTPVLSAVFFMIVVRLFFVQNYKLPIYLVGAFFFAAALFTYEQCVLLPIALLWIAFIEKERVKRRGMFTYAAVLFIVDIAYIIVRKLITSEVVGAYEGGNLITLNLTALVANTFRLFFRLILNPSYKTAFVCSAVGLILFVGLIIWFARKLRWNRKAVIFFTGITMLLIAPVISLGTAVNSFESGRYLYLPSIFFIAAISIAGVAASYKNNTCRSALMVLLIVLSGYWLYGKFAASKNYSDASLYAESIENKVQQHFKNTSDTLYIDTLHLTVHRLPVFRLGFKTGVKWLDNNVDTNKILIKYYDDEVADSSHEKIRYK